MSKAQAPKTPQEQTVEQIAKTISSLAKSVREPINGPLNKKALLVLLSHSTKLSQSTISTVLEALEKLESDYVKKK